HLVAMATAGPGEGGPLGTLDQLPAEPLEELLRALGRRRGAEAFSSAPPGAVAQLCGRRGGAGGREPLGGSQGRRGGPAADGGGAAGPAWLFRVAGARWLGPALAAKGGDLLRRVAQRLPEEGVGKVLLEQAKVPAAAEEWEACERAVERLKR